MNTTDEFGPLYRALHPRVVEMRKRLEDVEIEARYSDYYRRVGPAHLSAETCAAIERHLKRQK